jgi:hypothetical protein
MKKKVFSLMMALLLVFPGAMFAQNRVSNGAHGTPASPLSGTPAIRAVAPNAGNATIILTAGDVWEDGSGYQMLLDADATAYGSTIPETGALSLDCSGNESIYAEFEYKLPTNADGVCETSNIVINNSVSIQIPAGTYDWCITNPTPGDRIWIAAANGSAGGRQDDYVFEAGATYEFVVSLFGSNDGVDVTVTQGETPDVPVVASELTVHDGSATSGYVPVYGFYCDSYLKSEMVYPAAELSDAGKNAGEGIRVIHGFLAVEHADGAFEAHAGVDVLLGQGQEGTVLLLVVLHEHVVPDFQIMSAGAGR